MEIARRPALRVAVIAAFLGGILHIGMVTNVPGSSADRLSIVHNIGAGAKVEDVLFSWRVIGHYRYF